MALRGSLELLIKRMRRVVGHPTDGATDASLLERYIAGRDEAAFELLLWRHGPMVLSVCRRMLHCDHDAEDAFQAAFLLLARKAGAIRRREAVAAWLYQTAYRIALRARQTANKRPVAVPSGAEPTAPDSEADAIWRELRPVLDEEVGRLPEKYRLPIILCYLQGRTYAEASQELKCPRGTVAIRLQRAREMLRGRLTRRGLALTAATTAVLGAERTVSAALPAALVQSTLKAALLFAAGKAVAGAVSSQALTWTQGVLRAMFLSKVKILAAVVLLMGATGTGAGLLMSLKAEAPPTAKTEPPAVVDRVNDEKPPAETPNDNEERPTKDIVELPSTREGVIELIGTEIQEGEKDPRKDQATKALPAIPVAFLAREIDPKDPNAPPEDQWYVLNKAAGFRFSEALNKAQVKADWAKWKAVANQKFYVRWKEGDPLSPKQVQVVFERKVFHKLSTGDSVHQGQLVALVDPTVQVNDVASKVAKLEEAESNWLAAIKTKEEAIRRAQASELLWSKGKGFISEDNYRADLLNRDRYVEEERGKDAARRVANEDLAASLDSLEMYEIHSKDSGVIKEILKRPGEPVRAFEPVVRLEVESDVRDARQEPAAVFNVPAQREGVLLVVGTEAKAGAKIPANLRVTVKVDGAEKTYRRLRVGDVVEEGQVLARVDDRLASLDLDVQKSKLEAAEADLAASTQTIKRTQEIYDRLARSKNAVSENELLAAKAASDQAVEGVRAKQAGVRQAQAGMKEAQIVLEMYEIRSPVRGVVKAMLKSRGEAVKSLESVVQIQELRKE
jgi:RNA polymerase sigma factor (sigma-70 family)